MTDGWVLCYQTDEEYKAEVIKQLLENQALHPVMLDHRDSEFRLGNVELYISPEEQAQALKAIKENQKTTQ
ncbi:MAG: hypothetical protein ACJA1A_003479 [Saprospiraceae bacterium]|jgi:hypothetical protein